MDRLIDINEVAAILKVDISWVRHARRNGFPCYRIGKHLRFSVQEVMEWIKKNKVN